MINPRQITSYRKTGSSDAESAHPDRILRSYPTETLVEKDKKYTEQNILIPEFSVPGILAKPEWEGLTFYFMAFPTIFEYADFRLVDNNKYELLGFNGNPVPELTPELTERYTEAMQIHLEQNNEPSIYSEKETGIHDKEDIRLLTGKVKWHFNTYSRRTTDEENKILDQLEESGELDYENFDADFNYTTDYDLPVFKDENGNALMFVCRLQAAHFPGSHYLFYSQETNLVRQFSQLPKRKRYDINLTETDQPHTYKEVVKSLSDPAEILTDRSYFDKKIILPKYSLPGTMINMKYKGLIFHFVVTPIFNDSIDFRLTKDNQYELLSFDNKEPNDFTSDFLEDCKMEMEEDFEQIEDEPHYFFNIEESSDKGWVRSDLKLTVGTEPFWAQATLMREKTEEENQSDYDTSKMMMYKDSFHNEDYVTDYDLPEFKDENGDNLEFVAELNSDDVFGSYYLYFSPKTRLVRQFFQCT